MTADQTHARTSSWAVGSLVLAIAAALLSPTGFGGFLALLAVIAGHSARGEIRRGLRGNGLAIAGLVLGYLVLVGALFVWAGARH